MSRSVGVPTLEDRAAGVLLHVSSLPGPYGIGDLGPHAREFVAWAASAGLRIWQVLPLTVHDAVGCPYASPTAFAREPLLLSPDDLADDGFVSHKDKPYLPNGPVDWAAVRKARAPFLERAATAIAAEAPLLEWREAHPWVEDWGLFAALADRLGTAWWLWPEDLRTLPLHPARQDEVRADLAPAIARHVGLQWAFDRQWTRLRALAATHGIALWGDMPFFVGGGSADVWANRELFDLDDTGRARTISGVPPDAFSPTGQLWGHPQLVRDAHVGQGWSWWVERAVAALELVDVLRLDHFRGLDGVWSVPATDETAEAGAWIPGPGRDALEALRDRLGALPLVAEDLGVITDDVRALRDDFDLPGMAILQFAFGPGLGEGLPHNHHPNLAVYTGTHDNDTLLGWARTTDERTRDHARRYLATDDRDLVHAMMRAAWRSVARTAIVPMQDLLVLGSEARMNVPGVQHGNWRWRVGREALNVSLAARIAEQIRLSGRGPHTPEPDPGTQGVR